MSGVAKAYLVPQSHVEHSRDDRIVEAKNLCLSVVLPEEGPEGDKSRRQHSGTGA